MVNQQTEKYYCGYCLRYSVFKQEATTTLTQSPSLLVCSRSTPSRLIPEASTAVYVKRAVVE